MLKPALMTLPRDPDAVAWANAVQSGGSTVSSARLKLVSTLIRNLKADGVWSSLDRLWLFAAENSLQARTDLVARASASAANSPTFTVNRGYAGDALSTYIDSNFNPSTAGGKYSQNDAAFGAWIETAAASTGGFVGVYTTNWGILYKQSSTQYAWPVNATANSLFTFATQTGFFACQRTASNAEALFQNGSSAATAATSSAALENRNVTFLADRAGGNVTDGRLAAGFIGKSTQQPAFFNRLRTYMTAVGVA